MTAITPRISFPVRKSDTASNAARAAARTHVEQPDRPDYVAIYTTTILAVSAIFLFGVALPTAMVYGHAAGWGLGAFCAFWGGPSFGVMAASARVSAWYETHDKEF